MAQQLRRPKLVLVIRLARSCKRLNPNRELAGKVNGRDKLEESVVLVVGKRGLGKGVQVELGSKWRL